ncbi:DUF7935 family protein [Aquimarina intermedia]|uniref:Uncharacterized protein n=1 Tax=Aquimarina intermedia TaxID=350814 RepID=A0A5S5BTM7_9FLAO|nr:hypothetical protein [Aquimarina intermedia]TYP70367.1 hypothetical protein BD809_11331 [Aquimarina intermedia]
MNTTVLDILLTILPSLIVGLVAIYFFNQHFRNEDRRRKYQIYKENQNQSLPVKLQAYERMVLFLERISPNQLLTRISPIDQNKKGYEMMLIGTIEQEFEHNLSQQIYITADCWDIIKAAKNGTIATIRKNTMNEEIETSDQLREKLLTSLLQKDAPSDAAIAFVKKEVSELI